MTVTYTAEVATVRGLGCFIKLLVRWKGSIYKLVWMDLLVFLTIYYSLNLTYRVLLNKDGKEIFEQIVKYCYDYGSLIPLSFVLGFYVSIVMTRWWNQYTSIPFPDPLAVFVSATVHGQDERGRVMRRTIMRYVCLCVTMTFTMISPRVKKRFPTLDHFVDAGLLQQSERDIIDDLNKKFPNYSKHWLPIVWAASIITRARREGRIRDDFAVKTIIDELNKFRGKCGLLLSYDNISVPLVYTQVVTLAVYSYFLTTIMGHQWVEGTQYKFDLYFPVFTTLQFFFYVGWLKVAESLINPFGDDDDDFEVNWMVDRNLQVSYLIVDEMHHEHPQLVKDQYWDEVFPQELPYTAESEAFRDSHPLPSTANIYKSNETGGGGDFMNPSSVKIDDMQSYTDMNSGAIMFSARPQHSIKSKGSQASMIGSSVPDTMSRVNSVTSMLKKIFTREDSRVDPKHDSQEMANLVPSSTHSASNKHGGSVKISDQVIEEVDEQLTITSQRSAHDNHPSVIGMFGPPNRSEPIDVPHSHSVGMGMNNVYDPYPQISRSAPGPVGQDNVDEVDDNDKVSIGNSDTDSEDEFMKLKKKRSEERLSRLKLNLARSISVKQDQLSPELSTPSTPRSPPFN